MASKSNDLEFIINHFPHYRKLLEKLFNESDSFRLLCEDYFEVTRILENKKGAIFKIEIYLNEYRELSKGLEEELGKVISKNFKK